MKKELNELKELVGTYLNGDSIGSVSSLPPVGVELTVDNIEGREFRDLATESDVVAGIAKSVGEELAGDEHLHKFLAVSFKPSGVLSAGTLLRSPEIKWGESLDTKSARLDALQNHKIVFVCKEIAKSKRNRTYNIYHVSPVTINAVAPKG